MGSGNSKEERKPPLVLENKREQEASPNLNINVSSDLMTILLSQHQRNKDKESDRIAVDRQQGEHQHQQQKQQQQTQPRSCYLDVNQDNAREAGDPELKDLDAPGLKTQHHDPASMDLSMEQNLLDEMIDDRVTEQVNKYKKALDDKYAAKYQPQKSWFSKSTTSSSSPSSKLQEDFTSQELHNLADDLLEQLEKDQPKSSLNCLEIRNRLKRCLIQSNHQPLNCRHLLDQFEECVQKRREI